MQNKVNIIFDLDDTILDFKKGAQEGLENILKKISGTRRTIR